TCALKDTGRGGLSRGKARLRNALVVAQVGLALVLLVCAGLTTQGFRRLAAAYQGFDPANVLHSDIVLPRDSFSEPAKISAFFRDLLRGTQNLSGVASAALVANPPGSNVDNESTYFTIEGRPAVRSTEAPSADLQVASPDYFQTLRIRLVAGRFFTDSDTASAPAVTLISQTMAARFWPNVSAIGHRIKLGAPNPAQSAPTPSEPWLTVVGIVSDVRQNWWNPVARPILYRPLEQSPGRSMTLLLRAAANPLSYAPSLRELVRRLN